LENAAPTSDVTIAILSDIHYAGAAEQARGEDYEFRAIANPLLRIFARTYRHLVWMRHPLQQGLQLDRFLREVPLVDWAIVNGDYSCDTNFTGVNDAASFQSAEECLGKLRVKFGERARFTLGDHDLGKLAVFGGLGGMRLDSWRAATEKLGLQPFWKMSLGNYVLMGVTSTLIALPAFQSDTLPEELPEWQKFHEAHLTEIRTVFDALKPNQRVLLFCHDPTALPFLAQEESVRRRLPQIEHTVLGHLHTQAVFWNSRILSGLPRINFLGHSLKKLTAALNRASQWWQLHPLLCPSLSGTELFNDGGYYIVKIDPTAKRPARFEFQPMPR
jgi:hypothetical protein